MHRLLSCGPIGLGLLLLMMVAASSGCSAAPDRASTAAASTATITGDLVEVGGPASAAPEPVPGVVLGRGPEHAIAAVATTRGRYVLRVAPGTYTLTGRSPLFDGDAPGPFGCQASRPVEASVGQPAWADVFCQRR